MEGRFIIANDRKYHNIQQCIVVSRALKDVLYCCDLGVVQYSVRVFQDFLEATHSPPNPFNEATKTCPLRIKIMLSILDKNIDLHNIVTIIQIKVQ